MFIEESKRKLPMEDAPRTRRGKLLLSQTRRSEGANSEKISFRPALAPSDRPLRD